MLERYRKLTAGLVGAALILPAAGAAAADAQPPSLHDGSDRYERVTTPKNDGTFAPGARVKLASVTTAKAARASNPKTGIEAANLVYRVAKRVARRHDLTCRVKVTELGAHGIVECKGSVRGKRELSRQIRRLVREDKLIAPENSGYYSDLWNSNSQREVRIDWVQFGYFGVPA